MYRPIFSIEADVRFGVRSGGWGEWRVGKGKEKEKEE
jgi:hypothetical protein